MNSSAAICKAVEVGAGVFGKWFARLAFQSLDPVTPERRVFAVLIFRGLRHFAFEYCDEIQRGDLSVTADA